ncbi:ornithine cyclodeaminase family protein [Estrella lausannensis]|uniref:Ornithine cyclodeaminase n=1 Tax=Estrella lausannensis TaxID=483423 RepID=A0A0H5DUC8_9BACT|nr:deaminase [Estrella lausannensis]CRX39539.1 Ornithine cyclodeaminase [Estrella lausannensis]
MENLIITRKQIEQAITYPEIIQAMEEAFYNYSQGKSVVPPVGNLNLEKAGGEVHIKSGFIKDDDYYVVKIASHFKGNRERGIPPGNGVMLLFCQNTGKLVAILHDEGYLTDLRTAAAGALVARVLAPQKINSIGIVGTGRQAFLQLALLKEVTDCRDVIVFGRSKERVKEFGARCELKGFTIHPSTSLKQLAASCNLIVTTTSADRPLIMAEDVREGTHITGVGADSPGKQELDPALFKRASVVAVDSRSQCFQFGDTAHALQRGMISEDDVVEIGDILADASLGRRSEGDITIADLTGVAVQDMAAARLVYHKVIKGACIA